MRVLQACAAAAILTADSVCSTSSSSSSSPSSFPAAADTVEWLDAVRPGDHGDTAPPIGATCTDFDWAETVELQANFARHQHVHDCSSPDVRFLILRSWKVGGLASVMQEVASALHVAYVTDRVLLFQGEGGLV